MPKQIAALFQPWPGQTSRLPLNAYPGLSDVDELEWMELVQQELACSQLDEAHNIHLSDEDTNMGDEAFVYLERFA